MRKEDNIKNNSIIQYILIVLCCLIIIIIIFDYLNIPTMLNIDIKNFNMDFLNIIINSMIVICLYLFTYFIIDKKNINKSNNKRKICNKLLLTMYEDSLEYIEMFNRDDILEKLVEKIDFNALANEDKIMNIIADMPFENKDMIVALALDGELEEKELVAFFDIKKTYSQYMHMLITFFDHKEISNPSKKILIAKLKKEIENLTSKS
ncbi:MAG: hypothetical protein PHE29_14310 [Tissierellia bacterium]|nr:hypothetical protein [Tissierellia bacterium]